MLRPLVCLTLLMLGCFLAPVSLNPQLSAMQISSTKPGRVPLPKPDPNPNGDNPDSILKVSDKAACEAAGGVWVQRGETGFCFMKIESEPGPELELIEIEDPGGPAWNGGSHSNPFDVIFGLSPDSSASGDTDGDLDGQKRPRR
jgi:hypothetical protein